MFENAYRGTVALTETEKTPPPKGGSTAPSCKRCNGALELLTVLPRFGDHPSYRIFGCHACGFLEWIAEAVGN